MLVVDLFSGAGGMHIGFEEAGFEIGLCIDIDSNVEKTHILNFPHIPFLKADIREISSSHINQMIDSKKIDVLVGGPPCQGFSTIGSRVSSSLEKRIKNDPRNSLIYDYVRLLSELQPNFFVMENVKGLLTMNKGDDFKIAKELMKSIGYDISSEVINMADYGVPQSRVRVIIIGNRIGIKNDFPPTEYSENGINDKKPWVPCWEVISDLVDCPDNKKINHVALRHTEKIIERYKLIPEGGRLPEDKLSPELFRKNFGNTYKRLNSLKPALTMVPGNDAFPIHPILNRSLTVREAARIQTFPDSIIFEGNRRQTGHQVGNAVPPLFSAKLAKHLKDKLEVCLNVQSN